MKQKKITFITILLLVLIIVTFYFIFTVLDAKETISLHPNELEQNTTTPSSNDSLPTIVTTPSQEPIPTTTPNAINPNVETTDEVEQILQNLSTAQKIGQLLIMGIEDKQLTTAHQKLIQEQYIGSIILFKRNIKNEKQLTDFIAQLKQQNEYTDIPLWITIDQEGGIVNRLPEKFPSAATLAELHDSTLTYDSAATMGETLSRYGIDVDFAPVLDVNSNPRNPVIGDRAFGTTPQETAEQAIAMMQGLESYVITVGKHFPGHGDTSEDSHKTLPTVNKSWEELQQLELIPFYAAIKQQIDALMIGHLYFPQLDSEYPASLSKEIITNRLREEMGFTGLAISDDMVMGGITEQYNIGDAAIIALQAGIDMLIVGHDTKSQQEVITAITTAVENGNISEQLLDEHVRRVLTAKLDQ
ncbi:beta-N-acetylhexosaminidase [Paenibacillus endoradicis]|uniref:beta-N-acetylhexosaminidase n=1 Tax=Paenibacillus endoradicis TaxID=2972487 RepID=UPI00215983B0|nr:beta-N-acetylhexosaminidase [Paenibacillus endoradicis]MCR8659057.1 beta-N-acetylhexosaminidase [Paenibacillus endoradicis]